MDSPCKYGCYLLIVRRPTRHAASATCVLDLSKVSPSFGHPFPSRHWYPLFEGDVNYGKTHTQLQRIIAQKFCVVHLPEHTDHVTHTLRCADNVCNQSRQMFNFCSREITQRIEVVFL